MNYLSLENISKAYGERVLFKDINFGINKDQKIAFIAKNGTGKTSLLKIIAGKDQPDTGQVVIRKGIRLAYLSQEDNLDLELTVEQSIFNTDNPILKIIQQYEQALLHPHDTENYQKAFEAMENNHAWGFETTYKQILTQLQLTDLHKKVKELSGGQRKRLALAIALIQRPDLLILDEPTNHLDLEMIEWLEKYLNNEPITLFMVTHDRYFLERVCNEIIEMDEGVLYRYKGNYSYYLAKKEERLAQEQSELEKAKNLYKRELEWMRRQPKARTTKSKSRIDDFYEIQQRATKRRQEHVVQLEINMERLGSKILEFHKVSKAFGNKQILNKFDYTFKRGERIGIIGKNGTGKSSFLKMIMQTLPVDTGKIVIGDTIKIGYYSQDGIAIKPGQKVIEVIQEFGDYIPLTKGRKISAEQLLERFLFSRKQQYDFVEKLSGGEQKRLYLCTVLIQNPNFLILDEPTNDLDVLTLNVLENFLLDYPGNLLVVSHDRYFMDKIVDMLFVFRGNGVVEIFPGNYTDFRIYDSSLPREQDTNNKKEDTRTKNIKKKQLSYKEQRELQELEKNINQLTTEKKEIEALFSNNNIDPEKLQHLSIRLQAILDALEQNENRWLELSMIGEE